MRIGKICGSVWSTKKSEQLNGAKFMVIAFPNTNETLIAVDNVGAGIGDTVLIIFGRPASEISGCPTDAAICGILDKTEEGK